ncbi:MAG: hypothetical protein ACLT3D_09850 [Lawsonibacter sp.]
MFQGESGVGKSEVAIELIQRGHRIIADDAVEIAKQTNHGTLVATALGADPPLHGAAGHRRGGCAPAVRYERHQDLSGDRHGHQSGALG